MCRWLITGMGCRTGSSIEGFSLQVQSLQPLPIFNFVTKVSLGELAVY